MIAALLYAVAQQAAASDLTWSSGKRGDLEAAYIEYDVGITLTIACQNRRFAFLIGGLPPAPGETSYRKLDVNVPDDTLRSSDWAVSPNSDRTIATSTAAPIYARRLRATNTLIIRVPADGSTPARRYQLGLPSDHAPLDAVMTACSIPLENADDATYEPSVSAIIWERVPRITAPSSLPSASSVDVLIRCSVDNQGRPQNCSILDEQPARSGFGRYALDAVRTGRVRQIDGAPIKPGNSFTTRMTYRTVED